MLSCPLPEFTFVEGILLCLCFVTICKLFGSGATQQVLLEKNIFSGALDTTCFEV
jgi:hypothetical protein